MNRVIRTAPRPQHTVEELQMKITRLERELAEARAQIRDMRTPTQQWFSTRDKPVDLCFNPSMARNQQRPTEVDNVLVSVAPSALFDRYTGRPLPYDYTAAVQNKGRIVELILGIPEFLFYPDRERVAGMPEPRAILRRVGQP